MFEKIPSGSKRYYCSCARLTFKVELNYYRIWKRSSVLIGVTLILSPTNSKKQPCTFSDKSKIPFQND